MTRKELHELSRARLREARTLLRAGHPAGAYYLLGYAVECALKACIARATRRYDFPDKRTANQAHSHDLDQLVDVAGLRNALQFQLGRNASFAANWAVVKDWSQDTRYEVKVSQIMARDLYSACTARAHGVLWWIRSQW